MKDTPDIPEKILAKRFPGGFSDRDEANAIVAMAFRNGPLEKLHAGEHSELLEDDSLSRITDEEMKDLMISACKEVEHLLRYKETDPENYDKLVKSHNLMHCNGWER